jgi:hypothetical protein
MGSNHLTGSIPAAWAKLTNLYVVNVTRNEGICGNLPSGVPQTMVEGASTTSLNNSCSWEGDGRCLYKRNLLLGKRSGPGLSKTSVS